MQSFIPGKPSTRFTKNVCKIGNLARSKQRGVVRPKNRQPIFRKVMISAVLR